MKSLNQQQLQLSYALLLLCLFLFPRAWADEAELVQAGVLVETNVEAEPEVEGSEGTVGTPVVEVGTAKEATYVSDGGWAVTGQSFIDAAAMVFFTGEVSSVSSATLFLNVETTFPQNGSTPIEVFYFADEGVLDHTDYTTGFPEPIFSGDIEGLATVEVEVTGPLNAMLRSGQHAGFRVLSSVETGSVDTSQLPAWTGAKFIENYRLEFTPGPPPALATEVSAFDGLTLEVPQVDVNTIGQAAVQLQLIDTNKLHFQLTGATITTETGDDPLESGAALMNCSAFDPPSSSIITGSGSASYSISSGILDIQSVNFNGDQVSMRLEYIEGTDPWVFETLAIDEVSAGPSTAVETDLAGGIVVEPTQDFVPLCHGWILIGDSIRNRVVERNVITGQTGATYSFNTIPDQFTLDAENALVYMTVHPESERLYKLDLNTGQISHNRVTQVFQGVGNFTHRYGFALRDIAIGELGKVFALMIDKVLVDPENDVPFTTSGKWLGVMDTNADFLVNSIPLLEPVRVEYDPAQDHVFLATESNLVTFDFDQSRNTLTFVQGTDVAVGSGCTDFSISSDGSSLAYSCPAGNRPNDNLVDDFAIVDMSPDAYFDTDGEWFLGASPVSATFNDDDSILVATDNDKLYFFDAESHLLLEDFTLGLLEGETISKIRLSRDGKFLIVFLNNIVHAANSKFYWMPIPNITAAGLPPQ